MDDELRKMICDHMEKGFLENIIDMLKHDKTLYPAIIDMVKDERLRVRIGATALVEELVKERRDELVEFIPEISKLLEDPNPTIRGDGANLLAIIKHNDGLSFLNAKYDDPDAAARTLIREAIEDIRQN
ncbi:MAG: hypothetical protein HQL10_09865 [Nitrospirae bacterium]|nr:hypothetical protein [Nitrospirota bacterium]